MYALIWGSAPSDLLGTNSAITTEKSYWNPSQPYNSRPKTSSRIDGDGRKIPSQTVIGLVGWKIPLKINNMEPQKWRFGSDDFPFQVGDL